MEAFKSFWLVIFTKLMILHYFNYQCNHHYYYYFQISYIFLSKPSILLFQCKLCFDALSSVFECFPDMLNSWHLHFACVLFSKDYLLLVVNTGLAYHSLTWSTFTQYLYGSSIFYGNMLKLKYLLGSHKTNSYPLPTPSPCRWAPLG